MSDTAVVATYQYRHEAEFARSFLEMEEIESMISTDDIGGAYPGMVAPVKLLVRSEDAERARAVLAAQPETQSDD